MQQLIILVGSPTAGGMLAKLKPSKKIDAPNGQWTEQEAKRATALDGDEELETQTV